MQLKCKLAILLFISGSKSKGVAVTVSVTIVTAVTVGMFAIVALIIYKKKTPKAVSYGQIQNQDINLTEYEGEAQDEVTDNGNTGNCEDDQVPLPCENKSASGNKQGSECVHVLSLNTAQILATVYQNAGGYQVPKHSGIKEHTTQGSSEEQVTLSTAPNIEETDILIQVEHICLLAEFLIGYAHKWRLIGTALSLLPQELDAIQAEHASMVDFNKHNFINMISVWVLKNQPHTKPPTVNTLAKALASETVGLGKLASQLKSSVFKK